MAGVVGVNPDYPPELITKLLRGMPAERLSVITPQDFQRWPARKVTPAATIRELIANEKARRK